jgi:hypothetical protein
VAVAGPHTVRGDVSLFGSGPLGDTAVNLWVNQPNGGYAYSYINGPLRTDANGQFTASNLPDSHVALWAVGLQPCAVTADVRGDTSVTVEVFPVEAFDSTSPPRPQLAATEPAVSGQIYEMTADGRKPVAGAVVWLEETMGITYARTLSDLTGNYFVCNIDDLPTNAWLTVEADGFQNISVGPVNSPTDVALDIRLVRP